QRYGYGHSFEKIKSFFQKDDINCINFEAVFNTEMRSPLQEALLHKDLKGKAPLIEPNLRRNLGKWST
ncbi:TPA: hypothetical protein ACWXDE_005347, partial [Klebsiella pneumoniae]